MKLSPSFRVFLGSMLPQADLDQYDLDAINGKNGDLPKFKDHDSVIALCRHFIGVYRKRVDSKSTAVVTGDDGEEIWLVGGEEMPRSEMLELAREYDRLPGRFAR